jgi:hypothetical protein
MTKQSTTISTGQTLALDVNMVDAISHIVAGVRQGFTVLEAVASKLTVSSTSSMILDDGSSEIPPAAERKAWR